MGLGAGPGMTGIQLAFGTYEDALRMVGVTSEPRTASAVVSASRIQMFAALVRDANPSYWDPEFAAETWGGLLAPPGLLMGWLIPPPWLPTGEPRVTAIALRVPLPGTTFVNAANDAEFLLPIVEGDLLTVVEEVVSVSPEKQTHLGVGHFVETLDTFTRRDGAVVARNRNTLFRFTPEPAGASRRKSPPPPGVSGTSASARPDQLPVVLDEIDYQRVVMNSGATWDYFPGHFDPGYAYNQGHPTIFVNTMHLAGFADRIATDWAGPDSRVVRRTMRLAGPIYAGDTMVGRGHVARRTDTSVDLQIDVSNQRGELCCPVELTLQVPPS